MAPDTQDAVACVRELLGSAEYLAAFDAAERALESPGDGSPPDLALQHLAVLALARAGATDTAATRLAEWRLVERVDSADVALAEDVLGLEARIAKDRALAAGASRRARLAIEAAELYESVFSRFRRTYTGVNAATMWLVADDAGRAHALAREVLDLLDGDNYWAAASRAEAHLVLGDVDQAAAALSAADLAGGDLASRASTRRQLSMICDVARLDPGVLDALPVPVALHYCGHLPGSGIAARGRLRGSEEQRVAHAVRAELERLGRVTAFGSLAAGADVLVAEAVLDRGDELHVFLPFPFEEFAATSVNGAGASWSARVRRCLDRAASVTVTSGGRHGDDDTAFAYCSGIAMGRARVRAQFLGGRAEQLAIWDQNLSARPGSTAADVARWHAAGLPTIVIPVEAAPAGSTDDVGGHSSERAVRAMLFADVKGFSGLRDHQIRAFVHDVLGPLSHELDRAGVDYRNGWGDALYVVFDDIGVAADVALRLQEVMAGLDPVAHGLPPLGLRIGIHAGPVFVLHDPVRAETSYFGEHVTRAARIEPIAPPGAVYATEAFAALAALDVPERFTCEYVGQVPTAKNFGTMPMYLLRRRHSVATAG